MTKPPRAIDVFWCDACQRTNLYHPFKHYWHSKACAGTVHQIKYRWLGYVKSGTVHEVEYGELGQ